MKPPDPSPQDSLVAQRLRSLEAGGDDAIDRAGFFVRCDACGYEGSDRSFSAHPDLAFAAPSELLEFVRRHFQDHLRRKCPHCAGLAELAAVRIFVAARSLARDLVVDYAPEGFRLRFLDARGDLEEITEDDRRLHDVCLDSQHRVGRLLIEMGPDRQEDALRLLRTVATSRPDDAAPRLAAAQVLASLSRDDEALAEIETARASLDDDASLLHEAGNLLGGIALRAQDDALLARAVTWLEKALTLDPSERAPHLALGRLHLHSGDHDLARHHLEAAAADQRHAFAAAFHLGLLALELDRPEDALHVFDQLLEVAPYQPEVHRTRALALSRAGRPRDAHAALDEAARLEPDHPELAEIRATLPPRED